VFVQLIDYSSEPIGVSASVALRIAAAINPKRQSPVANQSYSAPIPAIQGEKTAAPVQRGTFGN